MWKSGRKGKCHTERYSIKLYMNADCLYDVSPTESLLCVFTSYCLTEEQQMQKKGANQ